MLSLAPILSRRQMPAKTKTNKSNFKGRNLDEIRMAAGGTAS
jgi:hypothetical protein